MQKAIIVEAEFIDTNTIRILEPLGQAFKKVKIIIEEEERNIKQRVFGCAKDWIDISPDFDLPLEDFKEYMK
jgi:hypothetical protein